MKKHILLVEPPYKSMYPPLGLMKISSWHKSKGDYVDFIKHTSKQYKNGLFKKGTFENLHKSYCRIKKVASQLLPMEKV